MKQHVILACPLAIAVAESERDGLFRSEISPLDPLLIEGAITHADANRIHRRVLKTLHPSIRRNFGFFMRAFRISKKANRDVRGAFFQINKGENLDARYRGCRGM